MTLVQAIILSIIQGLTEFLPVSSSGHLVLFQKIMGISEPPILFDVLLHLGTLFSILIFFRKDLISLLRDWKKKKNIWLFLIVGSVPAAVFGFLLNSKIEGIFNSLTLVGGSWIFFGLLLLLSNSFKFNKVSLTKKEEEVAIKDGVVVGLFQALALFPGISRSGSTIIGGLWQKFSKETAFKMSFFLSIPAILGAVIMKVKDSHLNGITSKEGLLAVAISAIIGYFSLKLLRKTLLSNKFYYFGFYCLALGVSVLFFVSHRTNYSLTNQLLQNQSEKNNLDLRLKSLEEEFNSLKNQDQIKINKDLQVQIKDIHDTYLKIVNSYEKIVDLRAKGVKTSNLDSLLASALKFLSDKNYASAEAVLVKLDKQINDETQKLAASVVIPASVPQNNAPPSAGYSRQRVKTDSGEFMVSIISADLNSTKVIVDTASDSTCPKDCPLLPLGDYVSRSGAFAGVNGSYFCPAEYPACADKKNSFDTLLMNKNKVYFNSDNNVYSVVPAVIFSGGSVRFVTKSLEWGRDTSVDAVITNQPLLIFNGQIVFGGDSDPKHVIKGNRGFVGNNGSTVYIGIAHNVTMTESASVMKALGMTNALNLDNGGSAALWYSGYKVGPGRNIPNAVLFVRK